MIADAREIRAYFAPQISETTFAGILATVNGRKLISVFYAERLPKYLFLVNMQGMVAGVLCRRT